MISWLKLVFFAYMYHNTVWQKDMELRYGIFESQLSEIFLGDVQKRCWTVRLHFGTLYKRYWSICNEICIGNKKAAVFLQNVVGFIDCTRIKMCRQGGPNENQRIWYNGNKKFHWITYLTISTTYLLMFALFWPEVGQRHKLTLYININCGQ